MMMINTNNIEISGKNRSEFIKIIYYFDKNLENNNIKSSKEIRYLLKTSFYNNSENLTSCWELFLFKLKEKNLYNEANIYLNKTMTKLND